MSLETDLLYQYCPLEDLRQSSSVARRVCEVSWEILADVASSDFDFSGVPVQIQEFYYEIVNLYNHLNKWKDAFLVEDIFFDATARRRMLAKIWTKRFHEVYSKCISPSCQIESPLEKFQNDTQALEKKSELFIASLSFPETEETKSFRERILACSSYLRADIFHFLYLLDRHVHIPSNRILVAYHMEQFVLQSVELQCILKQYVADQIHEIVSPSYPMGLRWLTERWEVIDMIREEYPEIHERSIPKLIELTHRTITQEKDFIKACAIWEDFFYFLCGWRDPILVEKVKKMIERFLYLHKKNLPSTLDSFKTIQYFVEVHQKIKERESHDYVMHDFLEVLIGWFFQDTEVSMEDSIALFELFEYDSDLLEYAKKTGISQFKKKKNRS